MNEQNLPGGGWICLWRDLLNKPIWKCSTPEQNRILITLLCMANHKPKRWEFGGELYEVQAGQFITSLPSIVEKCACKDITVQKVRTALKRFEKLGFLTDKSTNKNRLITIVNWEKYQEKGYFLTDDLTGNQQADNRQLTGNQQATNRQITANNNDNNINNDNNVNNVNNDNNRVVADKPPTSQHHFKKPTLDEIVSYCCELNSSVDPEQFLDYYEANGWKVGKNPMKDWRAAFRRWTKNNNPNNGKTEDKEMQTTGNPYFDMVRERHQEERKRSDIIDV